MSKRTYLNYFNLYESMEELHFRIGPLNIKARKTLPGNNNIPSKFIKAFKDKIGVEPIPVYNLTINGNGRFYYTPSLNFIAIYFLGEFHVAEEMSPYLDDVKSALEVLS